WWGEYMSAPNEMWQVVVGGEVYEADTETIKQWVAEGRILPTDKVKKGNLNWIEANRVPMLRAILNGEAPPPSPPSYEAPSTTSEPAGYVPKESYGAAKSSYQPTYDANMAAPVLNPGVTVCHYHPQLPADYYCRGCGATFCSGCPKFIGNNNRMAICSLCGELCLPMQQSVSSDEAETASLGQGFGWQDFIYALRYPIRDKVGLLVAAGFYGLLHMGGFYGELFSWMILFGCIALVINRVAGGNMDRNFMPDFSNFSWWDDVVHPVVLSVGISIVTLGPVVVLMLATSFGFLNLMGSGPNLSGEMPMKEMSTPVAAPDLPDDDEWKNFSNSSGDAKQDAEFLRKMAEIDPRYRHQSKHLDKSLGIAKEEERSRVKEDESIAKLLDYATAFLAAAIPIIILALLALFWALFYYPMALAVAGLTRSFWAVVNPLVGIDTIRRMGSVYLKAFLMYLGAEAVGIGLSIGLKVSLLALLATPIMGGLISNVISGAITFYINLVIACILGLALYKCADKLGMGGQFQ
ncbi:MAG: hypothetical protein AB1489_41955, partial [Acidobacteriota bacterium]